MPKYTQQPGQLANPPDSPAFAAFAAASARRSSTKTKCLVEFNESGAAHAAALGLVHTPLVAVPDLSARPVVPAKGSRRTSGKGAAKSASLDADLSSRYYRNKSVPDSHPRARLESYRHKAMKVVQFLKEHAYGFDDPFWRNAQKVANCSLYGAFRVVSPTVAHSVGRALCKNRFCPICQRVLAHKRQCKMFTFVDANKEPLSKYYFYHMVLTLRHSVADDVRNGLYVSELVNNFKSLRGVTGGKVTEQRSWWDKRVAGGFYSVETEPGSDGSPHIHMHILLLAKMPLYNARKPLLSEFLIRAKADWLQLSGDSTQVHVEPVFTWKKDEDGEFLLDANGKKQKEYARKVKFGGEGFEHLREAIAECAKYTLKTDTDSLGQFSDAFLHDLLSTKHRYFGRFGVLHARHPDSKQFKKLELLNTNFKDLEEIDAKEAVQLWDPERQILVSKSDTKMGITPFSNTRARTAGGSAYKDENGLNRGGEHYYSIQDPTKFAEFPTMQEMPKALSLTIYRPYNPEIDLV
jgi:hypothetical protein